MMRRSRWPFAVALVVLGLAALATAAFEPALWSVAAVRAAQSLGPTFQSPMEIATFLGSEAFFLLLVPLVFWCVNKSLGVDLAVLLVLAASTGLTVKAVLKHPRPFWDDAGLQLASGQSFSLPSGHTLHITVLLGYLALWLAKNQRGRAWQRIAIPAIMLLILLVGLTRAYLGVHFPGDLMWGWAIGIAIVMLYSWVQPFVEPWLQARSLWLHVGLAAVTAATVLAFSAIMLAVPVGSGSLYGERYSIARAQALMESASVAALILGMWIGLAIEARHIRFCVDGPLSKRVLRYLLGWAGIVVIWAGAGLLLPSEPVGVALASQIARYSAAAIWAMAGAPWLFVRLGLAGRQPSDSQPASGTLQAHAGLPSA